MHIAFVLVSYIEPQPFACIVSRLKRILLDFHGPHAQILCCVTFSATKSPLASSLLRVPAPISGFTQPTASRPLLAQGSRLACLVRVFHTLTARTAYHLDARNLLRISSSLDKHTTEPRSVRIPHQPSTSNRKMPDKRRKGATKYSSHRPTQKSRARIAALAPEAREAFLAKNHEYQAIRACCIRESQREGYINASVTERRLILVSHARNLLKKR
jgi:hypothetical protein